MGVHVFVGPSCPEPEIRRTFPTVTVRGPIRHGDLFAGGINAGDVAVVLDGVYHHSLALRHKEILDAIDRGVTVIGASSIGALRAVELESQGMIGVGKVFQWYRDGIFDGDDAVSVAHGDSGPLTGLNVPLVNLYGALTTAQAEGIVDGDEVGRLLALFEAEYYPLRSHSRVLSIAEQNGGGEFSEWFRIHSQVDPDRFDQKRSDALAAIAEAQNRAGSAGIRRPLEAVNGRDWRTEYHRRWRNRFQPGHEPLLAYQQLAYQQIFRPDFPELWWEYLELGFGRAQASLADHLRSEIGPQAVEWLAQPGLAHRITSVICPVPDLGSAAQRAVLLGRETALDRDTATRWLAATREHLDRHPARGLSQIAESTCAAVLSRIWSLGATDGRRLREESSRRGFLSLRFAADALRPFLIGYLTDLSALPGAPESRTCDHAGRN
ncbi:hypothetical protein ATKI12_0032 [Kitasatospora sp. Ki12]